MSITATAVVIANAPEDQRAKVAAREMVGGLVGGLSLGYVGHRLGGAIGSAVHATVSEFTWDR